MTRKILGKSTLGAAVVLSGFGIAQIADATSVSVNGTSNSDPAATATTSTPYSLAAEATKAGDTNAVTAMKNIFITTSIKNPDSIALTLTNAKWDAAGAAYHLAVLGSSSDTSIDDADLSWLLDSGSAVPATCSLSSSNTVLTCEATSINGVLGKDADNTSTTSATTAANLNAGSVLVLLDQSATDDTTVAAGTNIEYDITTKSGLTSGSNITLTVTETSGTTTSTGSATIATVTPQWKFCVTDDLDGVIDLSADPTPGAEFNANPYTTDSLVLGLQELETGGGSACTTASTNGIFVIDDATGTIGAAALTFTLTADSGSGITSVVAPSSKTMAPTSSGSGVYTNTTIAFGSAGSSSHTVVVTVDGSTVLTERDFTLTVKGVANSGYTAQTYLSDTDAGSWTLNGYSAYIPHMLIGNSSYTTFVKIVNTSTRDGDVMMTATICDSDGANCTTESNVDMGTVGAGESLFITGTDIDTAFDNIATGTAYQVDGTLIVNAPISSVVVTAITKTNADGSRATMTVMPSSSSALHQ